MPNDVCACKTSYPRLATAGIDGWLVQFNDSLGDAANRAALAFAAAARKEKWPSVSEIASTLTSVYVRFDPLLMTHDDLRARLAYLLDSKDWLTVDLPLGRKRFCIPCVWGGERAPQFEDAAKAAGMMPDVARAALSQTVVRVQTLGFSPGQPYLGQLSQEWNLPRQRDLTPRVPPGALVLAIRQFVLFGISAPTGWLHVGQTAVRLFDPTREEPFLLRPGDEVVFPSVCEQTLLDLQSDPTGGVTCEAVS